MKRESSGSTNVWDYKPAWCQPWSIILSGLTIITGSWLILHNLWLTTAIFLAIVIWWVYFLIVYPKAFTRFIVENQNSRE